MVAVQLSVIGPAASAGPASSSAAASPPTVFSMDAFPQRSRTACPPPVDVPRLYTRAKFVYDDSGRSRVKLATFRDQRGSRIGVVDAAQARLFDLAAADPAFSDMQALIEAGPAALEAGARRAGAARRRGGAVATARRGRIAGAAAAPGADARRHVLRHAYPPERRRIAPAGRPAGRRCRGGGGGHGAAGRGPRVSRAADLLPHQPHDRRRRRSPSCTGRATAGSRISSWNWRW